MLWTQLDLDVPGLDRDLGLGFRVAYFAQVGMEGKGKDGLTAGQRHKFGLDQRAVVLTKANRLLALELDSGKVAWSLVLPEGEENHGREREGEEPRERGREGVEKRGRGNPLRFVSTSLF